MVACHSEATLQEGAPRTYAELSATRIKSVRGPSSGAPPDSGGEERL